MQTVLSAIYKTLREHEYVVVPGLGGFTLQTLSATQTSGHVFRPASKIPSFNPLLIQDDGLLKQTLIQTGHSVAAATQQITEFTAHCKALLQSRKILSIPELGNLYQNLNGSITFDPNHGTPWSLEHYGLLPVQATPETTETRVLPLNGNSKSVGKTLLYVSVAASLFVLTGLLAFIILQQPGYLYQAGFNSPPQSHFLTTSPAMPELAQYSTCQEIFKQKPTLPLKDSALPDCYLVFGAFREFTNAQNLKSALKSKGFNDPVDFETVNQLIRVRSAQKYSSQEADQKVRNLQQLNQSVWISRSR